MIRNKEYYSISKSSNSINLNKLKPTLSDIDLKNKYEIIS